MLGIEPKRRMDIKMKKVNFELRTQTNQIIGVVSIFVVVLVEYFNNVTCFKLDIVDFIIGFIIFVLPGIIPAIVGLFLKRLAFSSLGSALFLLPFLIYAYQKECGNLASDGGASMVYLVVLFYGTLSSLIGAFLFPLIAYIFGVRIKT